MIRLPLRFLAAKSRAIRFSAVLSLGNALSLLVGRLASLALPTRVPGKETSKAEPPFHTEADSFSDREGLELLALTPANR